jgi:hypothetical protein
MTYSHKQALKLAIKFETKYGKKKLTKAAGNPAAVSAVMQNYEGTGELLRDVAAADGESWNELIEAYATDDPEDQAVANQAREAAKQTHKIIMDAANAVHHIEAKFHQ